MEAVSDIAADVAVIKWLLLVAGVLFILFLFSAMATLSHIRGLLSSTREAHAHQKYQRDAERMLRRGAFDGVVNASKGRLIDYPYDMWAHWFLAQALFHQRKLVDAKKQFEVVCELDPSMAGRVDPWLERLRSKLKDAGPQSVN